MYKLSFVCEQEVIPDTNYACNTCGAAAHLYLCNPAFLAERPQAAGSDRFFCCDNEDCVNRPGEEHFQTIPGWIRRLNSRQEYNAAKAALGKLTGRLRTGVACPMCGGELVFSGVMIMTDPPQQRVHCSACLHQTTILD